MCVYAKINGKVDKPNTDKRIQNINRKVDGRS